MNSTITVLLMRKNLRQLQKTFARVYWFVCHLDRSRNTLKELKRLSQKEKLHSINLLHFKDSQTMLTISKKRFQFTDTSTLISLNNWRKNFQRQMSIVSKRKSKYLIIRLKLWLSFLIWMIMGHLIMTKLLVYLKSVKCLVKDVRLNLKKRLIHQFRKESLGLRTLLNYDSN